MKSLPPLTIELVNRFSAPRGCNSLLYTPVQSDLVCRESRVYTLECMGSEKAVERFARDVLADKVSDEVHIGERPALKGHRFLLDVSSKPGLLDLEKEYILRFYRELNDPDFELHRLLIKRRIYFFGRDEETPTERFIKDIVNPVIHTWSVAHG